MKKLLVFLVLLGAAAGAAYHFGLLQRLMGSARLIPKDSALLAYFAPDTHELMLVQATAVDARFMKQVRDKVAPKMEEFRAKTGVHLLDDVDAIALADGLGVVRGRFDWSRLSAFLQSEGYTLTQLEGVPAAVKPQAADVALDGRYLLMGPQNLLAQAIARKRQGQGLDNGSSVVKAMEEIGWKHYVVGAVVPGSRLAELQPKGMGKELSLLGSLDMNAEEAELRGVLVTGDPAKGEEIRKDLEKGRQFLLALEGLNSRPETAALRDVLTKATLEANAEGRVLGIMRFPYSLADPAFASLSNYEPPDTKSLLHLRSEPDAPAVSGQPPASPIPPATTPAVSSATPLALDWKPPVLGLLLLALALGTMGAQSRPGLFNVLVHPLFLLPYLLATLGVFVLRWVSHPGGALDVLALPMPEWYRLAALPELETVAVSAAPPLVLALLALPASWLRRCAAGLAMGFSAWLAVRAFASPPLPLIPPAFTLYWYAGNALVALVLARLTLPPRQAKAPRPGARPQMSR